MTRPSPPVSSSAGEESQAAVDSEANSRHFVEEDQQAMPAVDETVSDSDAGSTQHQSVDHHELHTESVDSHSDRPTDKPPQQADSTDKQPVKDTDQSQPAVDSEPLADAADDAELHTESMDSRSDRSTDKPPQLADSTDKQPVKDADQSQPAVDSEPLAAAADDELHTESVDSHSDRSADSADKQSVNDAEQSQPVVDSEPLADADDGDDANAAADDDEYDANDDDDAAAAAAAAAADPDDSWQGDVNVDEVRDIPDNFSDKQASSENVEMPSSRAGFEGVTDDQLTAAGNKGTVDGYLAPLVNLWAAVDAWMMTCIDSVSSKCVIDF